MSGLRGLALSLALLGAPGAAFADVPGAPPAEPPDCPEGTRLEGPYRYWSCVPCAPDEPCDPPVPVVVEPTPAPAVAQPTAPPPPQPASRDEGGFGCSAAPAAGGRAWTLLLVLGVLVLRRREP